jgi:hypothetical protein
VFSFVRNLFSSRKSETQNLQTLKDLHTGYSVGFGYMPQTDLSGRRFRISEVNSYRFGAETFLAYTLQHEALISPVQLIADLTEEDPYLALSQIMDPNDQKQLFGREISAKDSLFLQDKIVFDVPENHRLGGWAASSYKKVINGIDGEYIRGHYQLQAASTLEPWSFKYYLFVSESNDYAVEIENYDHGICKISLTVFRPITDIGQIRKPVQSQLHVAPKKMRASMLEAQDDEVPVIAHEPVVKTPVMVLTKDAEIEVVNEPRRNVVKPITSSQNQNIKGEEFTLPCPASVAAKLIEESQRNQIPLSQLVRKILGLNIHMDETVLIPFSLSPADIKLLTNKFGIDAHNTEVLRSFLLKEVSLFVGEEEEFERKKERV